MLLCLPHKSCILRVTPILVIAPFGLTGAVASTEVKQKLQEFLLSKSAKDPASNGGTHSFIHHPKLWYRWLLLLPAVLNQQEPLLGCAFTSLRHIATHLCSLLFCVVRSSHHTSLDQSSSPLGGMSPTCHYTLPSPVDGKDDFPLRKTGPLFCICVIHSPHVEMHS